MKRKSPDRRNRSGKFSENQGRADDPCVRVSHYDLCTGSIRSSELYTSAYDRIVPAQDRINVQDRILYIPVHVRKDPKI